MLTFRTVDHWDEELWREAAPVYSAAFPPSSSKKPSLIRTMLQRRICFLHVAQQEADTVAMAISSQDERYNALIIDYLAVAAAWRSQGVGREFLELIAGWAADERRLEGIIIEVEAEPTEANMQRIRFWERCGFTRTDYVHSYRWVAIPRHVPRPDAGRQAARRRQSAVQSDRRFPSKSLSRVTCPR